MGTANLIIVAFEDVEVVGVQMPFCVNDPVRYWERIVWVVDRNEPATSTHLCAISNRLDFRNRRDVIDS